MADEECAQLVDLLQQTWSVISAGGQCRVERCFRVARPGSSGQYVALKTAVSVLYVAGYCNNHPVIVGRNINASVNFYWLIKFCLLNLYTEFLSVCVHELDYLADKYCFTERNESPRLRRQWQDVLEECRQTEAGPEERLRIALLNVDYVTSFELPFRLLLTRTPQLIAALREEWGISQKNVVFNDKRFGCVCSLKASLSGVPDTYRYHLSHMYSSRGWE